eukprot:CAMPEP_0174371308 /NCGR_PEP_ID=MMETSP0811_2-20130205/99317_1 /TAXON_ID=73025 ORGANISM="Eutreptiella gymnastica-like, Strain CCMP1594" /NCGR_SAMPLE_ID=MMETSP0811_2 /ASSEMBLY_ACC=CAM_ASM_000667 /LENGTH=99 /DNA_ID=CAMNT_0015517583 /DNA_START=236 /DNA_END=535 /DNA_ORIENTATION=-
MGPCDKAHSPPTQPPLQPTSLREPGDQQQTEAGGRVAEGPRDGQGWSGVLGGHGGRLGGTRAPPAASQPPPPVRAPWETDACARPCAAGTRKDVGHRGQ